MSGPGAAERCSRTLVRNGGRTAQETKRHAVETVIQLNPGRLRYPPTVRHDAPDCFTALVEASVRSQFGLTGIPKAWFGYSFVYRPPPRSRLGLLSDGRTLNAELGRSDYGERRVLEKLGLYYGVAISQRTFRSFDSLLVEVGRALKAGELVISPFGVGFLKGWYEYGEHQFGMTHVILPTELNLSRATLTVLETILGSSEIDLQDYERCFERIRREGRDFPLWYCRREQGHEERPVCISDARWDLRECVEHLRSADPNQGLNALSRAIGEISEAFERLKRPAKIPGLWTFGPDRCALRENLPHWRAACVASDARIAELDELLGSAIAVWSGINAVLHTAVQEQDASQLSELKCLWQDIVCREERIAEAMETIYRDLPARVEGDDVRDV